MVRLSTAQRQTLVELCRMKIMVRLLGVERQTENPVVWTQDQVRRFPMAVVRDGSGRPPSKRFGVRKLTEDEALGLMPQDADILLSIMPVAEITPDLLQEVWFDGR